MLVIKMRGLEGKRLGPTASFSGRNQPLLRKPLWNRKMGLIASPSRSFIVLAANADGFNMDMELSRLAETMDSNELQTALARAVANEEYAFAARIRDLMKMLDEGSTSNPANWYKLGLPDWLSERAEQLGYKLPTEVQRRAAPVIVSGSDAVIKSGTGSGKTLAFLLPALAQLDYTVPRDDLLAPQLLILVPTRELGVQIALLVWRLFGGNISSRLPGDSANMFHFNGPRLLKVAGILDEDEAYMATDARYLKGVHVVVGVPKHVLSAATGEVSVARDGPEMITLPTTSVLCCDNLKAVCVDEVDACFHEQGDALKGIFAKIRDNAAPEARPQTILVGATLDDASAEFAASHGILRDPVAITIGKQAVPKTLTHRYIVVEERRKLAVLARLLRAELRAQPQDEPPARVMVFARSEGEAVQVGEPLRAALWNQHRISTLLPSGFEPIKALHSFRDNETTMLIATPQAARGLDLPAVRHVYNLSPPESPTQYIHRAGRAGRVGATVKGVVTTLVDPGQAAAFVAGAAALGLALERVEEPGVEGAGEGGLGAAGEEGLESARLGLEDLFNLY